MRQRFNLLMLIFWIAQVVLEDMVPKISRPCSKSWDWWTTLRLRWPPLGRDFLRCPAHVHQKWTLKKSCDFEWFPLLNGWMLQLSDVPVVLPVDIWGFSWVAVCFCIDKNPQLMWLAFSEFNRCFPREAAMRFVFILHGVRNQCE